MNNFELGVARKWRRFAKRARWQNNQNVKDILRGRGLAFDLKHHGFAARRDDSDIPETGSSAVQLPLVGGNVFETRSSRFVRRPPLFPSFSEYTDESEIFLGGIIPFPLRRELFRSEKVEMMEI